jgi:response regulator RpfG family c-di-GMP phosphodiesterase
MTAATSSASKAQLRILCVDDDPHLSVLSTRVLGTEYEVVTAASAAEALEHVQAGPPFAVVVSDYRMPDTDGVTLLGVIRDMAPTTVRVLLTGSGDLGTAVDAVNRGHIFRFLSKPCAPDNLRAAVGAAAEQHLLLTAEQVLLTQTLHGSVKALTDVLALAQPVAYGRATRVRRHAAALAERLEVRDRWPIDVAAMLSQVGCAALPSATLERYYQGEHLSDEERDVVTRLPDTAEQLIADIPRLDAVREILRYQDIRFDGRDETNAEVPGRPARGKIPIGARLLKVALDFDLLEMRGVPINDIVQSLLSRTGWYDPAILTALRNEHGSGEAGGTAQQIRLVDVRVGMVFAADVRSDNGMLLVARGQEVSGSLVERIRHQWHAFANKYDVSMLVPAGC